MISLPPVGNLRGIAKQSLVEVWDTLLGLSITEAASAAETSPQIRATIGLIGNCWSGEVRLLIPNGFARMAAGLILRKNGPDALNDAEVDDLSGELCNMIAGRVAS